MRRKLSLVLLLSLLGILAIIVWSRRRIEAPEAARLEGRYRTEEEWIVAEIAQDVAEMTFYGATKRGPGDALAFTIERTDASEPAPRFQVRLSLGATARLEHAIVLKGHIWSPEAYEGLARASLEALDLRPAPASPSTDEQALETLLNPRARVIETQNERVSARLASDMLDPQAHDEAALVIGALAFREASGYFWDVRQLLCRMTAHLAMARALRGESAPGTAGRYAHAILALFSGRTAEALAQFEGLRESAGASEAQAAWLRSLALTITGDWRVLPDPWKQTLFEQLSYYKAVRTSIGSSAAAGFYEKVVAEPIPDWGRIALQGSFFTEVGSFSDGIEQEIAEARDLWERINGQPLPSSDLVSSLNQPAERCVTAGDPRVIAWGTWAASLQRHVCHRILGLDWYLRRILGAPERADATIAEMNRRFRKLTLYPLVQSLRWNYGGITLESFVDDALNAAVSVVARQPELIPPSVWTDVSAAINYGEADYGVVRRRLPDPRSWFAAPVPAGTAYNADVRWDRLTPRQNLKEWLATLRQRDPWSQGLTWRDVKARYGENPSLDVLRKEFGSRAEYDLWLIGAMAIAAEPRSLERTELIDRQCRLLPDDCIGLAEHLIAVDRDSDAAKALQRAFDGAYDRVRVANHTAFLARYYYDHGQAEEATRVAESAAATGSARGMKALALLQEWRGHYAEAEELFTQIDRRYENANYLLPFYHRLTSSKGRGEYQSKLERLLPKTFPDGLERLDPARLPTVPRDGVRFAASSKLWGIKAGAVAVACDGWRVHNLAQYEAISEFDQRPEVDFHVWQGGRYSDVRVRILRPELDVEVSSYP